MKSQITNPKSQKIGAWNLGFGFSRGFTLIELIIVFSIITILSSIGLAGFVAYNHSQTVDTDMKDFKATLFTARSRALSQLRDTSCYHSGFTGQGYVLEGYQVVACCSFGSLCQSQTCSNSSNTYELQAVYANSNGSGQTTQTCSARKLSDPTVHIDSSSKTTATYFFFSAVSGAVTTNAQSGTLSQIGFTGYGVTKLATVSATGVIQ